jgi:hypothetical protein
MANEEYIPIRLPFSEDKELGGESDATTGIFPDLTNYVVGNKVLKTREGIEEFGWSEEGYIPADDPDCIMHLKMDGGQAGFRDDEIQGDQYMQVTAVSSISPSTTYKVVGDSSLKLDYDNTPGAGLGLFYYKKNNALPATFPGQGGTDFICGFWMRIEKLANGMYVMKHDATGNNGGWGIQLIQAGTITFYANVYEGALRNVQNTKVISLNQWYHVGMWSSDTLGKSGLVVYSQTDQDITEASQNRKLEGVATTSNTQFWCGMDRSNGITYTDDFILCDTIPATEAAILDKITLMRSRGI